MKLWVKHPNTGKVDTMLTFSVYAVATVLFKFLFSEMSVGNVTLGGIDSGVVAAILTPILGAFVAKRHSDNVIQAKGNVSEKQS